MIAYHCPTPLDERMLGVLLCAVRSSIKWTKVFMSISSFSLMQLDHTDLAIG